MNAAKPLCCEDCGDETPKGRRRRTCPRCGLKVCSWCMHHIHFERPEPEAEEQQALT